MLQGWCLKRSTDHLAGLECQGLICVRRVNFPLLRFALRSQISAVSRTLHSAVLPSTMCLCDLAKAGRLPRHRCVSIDGDADRVVYFAFKDGRIQLYDGDRWPPQPAPSPQEGLGVSLRTVKCQVQGMFTRLSPRSPDLRLIPHWVGSVSLHIAAASASKTTQFSCVNAAALPML